MAPSPSPTSTGATPRLHTWLQAPVVSVAAVVIASGFGQFGAVAALGDVAAAFGEVTEGASVAEQAGLSGTVLGLGLAAIRLASLASLPLAGLADRLGRKAVVLGLAAAGLALTAAASLSPGYWWFVAVFALSRPFLSATTAVAQVTTAEHTAAGDRARALALTAAGYGVGAALVAVVRGAAGDALGFRGLFALALVPLVLLPVLARWMSEPDRYRHQEVAGEPALPVLGVLRGEWGRRLLIMAAVAFAVGFVTGPANSFVFVYGENVVGLSPAATAVLVVAALPAGLAGLVLGRWVADRWGRRPCAVGGLVGLAAAVVLAYSGSAPAAVGGVLLSVVAGYGLSPALAAFAAELFPTSVRATVAGWLVAAGVAGAVGGLLTFGALADLFGRFAPAAVVVAAPALLATLAFAG
ncbi:MAG: MFS transporter, partial [Actinobacteria bacterium]|nr:MFS transporter [Actinomycetota bacterium]